MRVSRGVLLALALVSVTIAACGDDGGSSGGGGATTPASGGESGTATVRTVSQNILHGIACPPDTDRCSLPQRVELFVDQLAAADCPELVGLQESNAEMLELFEPELADVCDGRYEIVRDDDPAVDREAVLTTLDVLGSRRLDLAGPLRTGLVVRVAAPVGVVEFVTTHLASSSDDRPCDARTCPPPCEESDTLNTCQAREIVDLVEALRVDDDIVVLSGDLNAKPDEPTITAIRDAGYVDTHVEAGNDECDPDTGAQCTSGRIDDSMQDLTAPESLQTERIDYIWLRTDRDCSVVDPTGLFNGEPAEDGTGGLAFPSDHTAVQATLSCATSPSQVESATDADLPPPPTTTTEPGAGIDAEAEEAITTAYEALFGGDVTDVEVKLAYLEDADLLRETFLASYEQQREIASRISVRIDSIEPIEPDRAAVTYSLLLDGDVVLDHLPGEAVRSGDDWLVTRQTYCDVATQGQPEIPEACREP